MGLMLPLAWLALEGHRGAFLSNQHAHLLAKALLVLDRGRVELLGFVYPPLPFFLLLPVPYPLAASLWAALFASWLAVDVWQGLLRRNVALAPALAVWAALVATPSFLYLATQGLSEMLTLTLLVAAWKRYLRFTRGQASRDGFLSGLLLGLAFFAHYYAVVYGFIFALLVPSFWRERRVQAWLAAGLVLFFPIVWAVLTWVYLNALFTPDPLRFLRDPTSSLFIYTALPSEVSLVGWPLAWRSLLTDLAAAPLYLGTLVLLLQTPRRHLGLYLAPFGVIAGARVLGLVYPPTLARVTLTLMALIGLPRLVRPAQHLVLAAFALAQLATAWHLLPEGEPTLWLQRLQAPHPTARDREEMLLGRELAGLPPRSVLTDDRVAYRVIARTGTARPFLLPPDTLYPLAESAPARFVAYILAPVQPADTVPGRVSQVYARTPPPGFVEVYQGEAWRVYRRVLGP